MSFKTYKKVILQKRGRNRTRRLKTFKTEEAAKAYAESLGLKNYTLVNTKYDNNPVKKIKIVPE